MTIVAVLLPLLSFVGISLIPGKQGRGAFFSIINISISFILSVYIFSKVWSGEAIHQQMHWFSVGSFHMQIGILLNKLSVLMLLLVSLIALLVHIYSTKYMQGDLYLHRYWAYLGLFCFSMLGLVVADNLLLLYMFWELVGFSSYLLIGFWFTRESAAQASKKAFIMNRLGDLGFLTGLMIIFAFFRTFDIETLFGASGLMTAKSVTQMPEVWITVAGLAFFFGACAKSAQFPLHTWLPDAMEGPTSVSSLIHAATMVAAGVFLLARIHPLFTQPVLITIASIGSFTAFMAATIALTQNDIKRILAFSTISQLGFMMIAMGIGANAAGIFHLVTHAFFKCLLFLAAGSVIHELAHVREKSGTDFDHQNIQNMGGLRHKMPVTFITMLLASLALAGIPFSSGFLSKDAILIQAFSWAEANSPLTKLIPYAALLTSWLTVFYIARLLFKVFFGKLRLNIPPGADSIHEAPGPMKYVLIALALFCLFPAFALNPFHYDHSWLYEAFSTQVWQPSNQYITDFSAFELLIPVLVSTVSIVLIIIAYKLYTKPALVSKTGSLPARISEDQWYINEIYQLVFVNGIINLSGATFRFDKTIVDGIVNLSAKVGLFLASVSEAFDKYLIDALVNGAASLAKTIGNFARRFQTGRLQHYMLAMVLAVLTFFLIQYFSQAI